MVCRGQTQGREGLDASSFRNLSRDQGRGLTPVPRLTLEEALACDLGSEPSMYIMVGRPYLAGRRAT